LVLEMGKAAAVFVNAICICTAVLLSTTQHWRIWGLAPAPSASFNYVCFQWWQWHWCLCWYFFPLTKLTSTLQFMTVCC
jgi:hypothetical protein